jgi:hypothetical protein
MARFGIDEQGFSSLPSSPHLWQFYFSDPESAKVRKNQDVVARFG